MLNILQEKYYETKNKPWLFSWLKKTKWNLFYILLSQHLFVRYGRQWMCWMLADSKQLQVAILDTRSDTKCTSDYDEQ